MKNRITELLGIEYPIISGGMVWCSGHRLASAVSLSGGLGLLGAGSMHPETLAEHIDLCRAECEGRPFGVNIPLFYPQLDEVMGLIAERGVDIVFTSGGNPSLYTGLLKARGVRVVHVVANTKFALKAQAAGCDAVVVEGFEAGGHNGKDELTTMVATAAVASAVDIPVIAAGGIGLGRQVAAAMALGAEGVQIGSRFAMCDESSAHERFKDLCRTVGESDTMLCLKKLTPARLIRNDFYGLVAAAEDRGASAEELRTLLGKGRAKSGMFLGELPQGELEIGQVAAMINRPESVAHIFEDIIADYNRAISRMEGL